MYSWIASWFTGGNTDHEVSAYIKQDKSFEKEDWIWVETMTEEKNDGLIYVQSARTDLHESKDDPEPRSKSCARRKRSFSADVHESARKRVKVGRSSGSNRDLLGRYFLTVGVNLPKSLSPYGKTASVYSNRPLEIYCARRDAIPILTAPRRHARFQSFRPAVSEILSMSYSQLNRNQCNYPDMDWSMKSFYVEPGSIALPIIKQLVNALNTARQEFDRNAHGVNTEGRKPLRSIWWRDSEHQPGEIFPRATRHRLPSWLRRITPGCVEYVDEGIPHWMRNIRLFDDAALCSQGSIVMHDVPRWIKDIDIFSEEALSDDESVHFMPHWMRRVEVDKFQVSQPRFLCNHSALCHTDCLSTNESRFLNRFPSWMSESNFAKVRYDAVLPDIARISDDLIARRCPWDHLESAAERGASDWEPCAMQIVPSCCRAVVPRGCRDIVPTRSRYVFTGLSEYCTNMRDIAVILEACTLRVKHVQGMNPSVRTWTESVKAAAGSIVDTRKTKVRCSVVSRKQKKHVCEMTVRWRQKELPNSIKNLIRSNKMMMSRGTSRNGHFFQSKIFL